MANGIHELTAGYALDALDDDERRAYEEHLAGCERCRDELASFWDVTSALAAAASGPEPAPDLRERVLASVRAEPQNLVPLAPRRRGYVLPAVAAVAAAAAAVAIGLGLYALSLSNDLDEARSALTTVPLQGTAGQLVVNRGGSAVLVLSGLPNAPAGKTYELWVIEDGAPVPAGLFDGAPELTAVPVEHPVGQGAVVAITVEADGGVDAPTSEPVVASQPVQRSRPAA